jgi:signal transduction histidine kinase
VFVKLSATDLEVELIVRDQGKGIDPVDQERIFGRFERAVPSSEVSGFGLGLYIARTILELHGGSIAVQSKLGEGATFFVRLPRRRVIR